MRREVEPAHRQGETDEREDRRADKTMSLSQQKMMGFCVQQRSKENLQKRG